MSGSAGYDTRKYECCAPYYGDIGEEFTRRFQPEFEGALHSYVDNYASLYEHVVLQNDPGSAANPAPAGPPGQAMRQAYSTRMKKSFGLIRRHVEDPTIRDDIDANAMGDGPQAWQIVVGYGQVPQTYLNLSEQEKEWAATKLTEVGFNERTVENFRALIARINRERPPAQQKTNIQMWQKLLEEIGSAGNAELKTLVRGELQRQTMVHAAGHPLAGQPDVGANVMYFAERWRSLIGDGSIKRLPARKKTAPSTNRVDAMMVNASEREDCDGGQQLFMGQARVSDERMCYNCKGLGHTRVDQNGKTVCPSPVKPRSLAHCIAALEQARKQQENTRGGKRRFMVKRPQKASGRLAGAIEDQVEMLEIDEENNIYSPDGECVGRLSEMRDDSAAEDATEKEVSTVNAGMVSVSMRGAATDVPDSGAHKAEEAGELWMDADFEEHFVQSMAQAKTARASAALPSSDIADDANRKPRRIRRATMVTAGVAVGVAAMVTNNKQAGKILMLTSLLCCVGAKQAEATIAIEAATNNMKARALTATTPKEGAAPSGHKLTPSTGMVLDTGASLHASGRKELFPPELITCQKPRITVEIANDAQCAVEFQGTLRVPIKYREHIGTTRRIAGVLSLPNAIYVPALGNNTLISPKAMFNDINARAYFNDDKFIRLADGKIIDFEETDNLYILPFELTSGRARLLVSKSTTPSADDLHSRCMHFSLERIRRSSHCLDNADVDHILTPSNHQCDTCQRATARRHNAPARTSTGFTHFGQCIVSDTCDMEEYSTPFGFRYFLTFMDMATKYIMIYFLRTHSHAEVRAAYLLFLADAAPYLRGGRVELWFMDNGSEFNVSAGVGKDKPGFFANSTDSWLAEYFTRRRFIVPWNPQSNPAESVNRILLRPARAALLAAGVSTRFWPFALHQACVVHNALVTVSRTAIHAMMAIAYLVNIAGGGQARPLSPFMMVHKRKFDASLLHTLFCVCYCTLRNPSDLATLPKAAARTTKAMHLGLDHRRAGYFVYLFAFKRFTTSAFKDTHFACENDFNFGDEMPKELAGELRTPTEALTLPTPAEQEQQRNIPEAGQMNIHEAAEDRDERILADLPSSRTRSRTREQYAMLISVHEQMPEDFVCVCASSSNALIMKTDLWRPIACPTNTKEAFEQDKEGWLAAYKADFEAKAANGSFRMIDRQPDMIVHKTGWQHKLRWNDDNTLAEKRARLVGRGYSQVQGRDYKSSYSATPRSAAVRIFEAAICAHDMEDEHCDVVKAFTQNDLDDAELIIEQPPGLPPSIGKNGKPQVMVLLKTLEGFKQSGHVHQRNHTETFTKHNEVAVFESLECEPTIMVHRDAEGEVIIMALVWTDDVHFAYAKRAAPLYERFLSEVYGKRWNFKRKGPAQKFVGLHIQRNREEGRLTLSAPVYIEGIYKRFVPPGHRVCSAPYKSSDAVRSIGTAKDSVERARMADKPYLSAVASCIWIYSVLRPDIAFMICTLCSVMHDPSEQAWEALLDLIAYLFSTMKLGLCYKAHAEEWKLPREAKEDDAQRARKQHGIHAWCDSSWRSPSVAGFIILLMGCPLDWAAKIIKVICHSSAEAEVAAGCHCVKALMYLRQVCNGVGLNIDGPILMLLDSEAGIAIGNNMGVSPRTAHFIRWQHYLRWANTHFYTKLSFVSGKRQRADALTKPVDTTLLREFRIEMLGA